MITQRLTRRTFIEMLLPGSLALHFLASCSDKNTPLPDTYPEAFVSLLTNIRQMEADSIRDIANIMADTIIARKHCFFYTGYQALNESIGSPALMLPPVFIPLRSREMAETLQQGDSVLITDTGDIPDTAKNNGAHISGITSPSCADDYKDSQLDSLTRKQSLKTIASPLIQTRLPVRDGVSSLPGLSFDPVPISFPILLTLLASITVETYARSGGIGLTDKSVPAAALAFIDILTERIRRFPDIQSDIEKASVLVVDTLTRGDKVIVADSQGIIVIDLARECGAPLFARPLNSIEIPDYNFTSGDTLIFTAVESNNLKDMGIIRSVLNKTKNVISISPYDASGGYRLHKAASVAIDNLCHEREGLMEFDNGSRRFMKTGLIINSILFWTLIETALKQLDSSGLKPSVLMGKHLVGHETHNARARESFEKQGY